MILQDLCKYYDILSEERVADLPREGYSMGKISFVLILSKSGELNGVMDLREMQGKKIFPKQMLIPEQSGRAGKNAPSYFLSDNVKYALGIGDDENFSAFNRFKELHIRLLRDDNPFIKFLNDWNPAKAYDNAKIQKYKDEFAKNPNVIFKIEGQTGYLHDNDGIFNQWYKNSDDNEDDIKMQCLVTGKYETIAKIHTPIKGIRNSQAAGASIVSFNDKSFLSYGKESSYNAPIGKESMFKYTTVLKYMLNNKKYHLYAGDATVVFWAEKTGIYEDLMAELFNPSEGKADEVTNEKDTKTRDLAKDIIEKYSIGLNLRQEKYDLDPSTNVHILGISPNNARLSIAYYEVNTFEYFIKRLANHYNNLKIVGNEKAIPLWIILNETLSKTSTAKKVSPVLSKGLMNSIFSGDLYPASLYNAMISRIRADRDINYKRVAIIKACLMRKYKLSKIEEEISVSLNENSSSVPYQLGRLFAVLEKAQKEALGITTIKDRYFTSASATPASVFPVMMKLSLHHTTKAEYGANLENQKGQILDKVNEFPKHLSLNEQGEFIIGYYHQNQAFYVKKDKKGEVK
ncbi:type I-C CRISPR-associated protein Cas8c/Csd1 [Clostridium sp.]|uniref:type I-C CRISPR-associated protein Cas8c/Csd1 n=1 Tax=Clostridium sp. TaxID=1506 RepID=UPI003D6C8CED